MLIFNINALSVKPPTKQSAITSQSLELKVGGLHAGESAATAWVAARKRTKERERDRVRQSEKEKAVQACRIATARKPFSPTIY